MQSEFEDLIPTPVIDFYELFKQDLSNVAFPDISLEVLDNLIDSVHEKMNELQEANSKVIAAQEALETCQNELLQKSIRGLAYAKIYAQGQEELIERLSKINLIKASRTSKKASEPTEGKRSRSKKSEEPKEVLSEPQETSE